MMRAKLIVESVTITAHGEQLKMRPVFKSGPYPPDGSDENNTFAKWSPSGSFELYITNPALHGQFKPGQMFYADFTEAK